jgi:hypothetical protein
MANQLDEAYIQLERLASRPQKNREAGETPALHCQAKRFAPRRNDPARHPLGIASLVANNGRRQVFESKMPWCSSKSKNLLLAGSIWGFSGRRSPPSNPWPPTKTPPRPHGFSLLLLQKTAGFASGFLRYIPGKK